MSSKLFLTVLACIAGLAPITAASGTSTSFPSDSEIQRILADRIDNEHMGLGIVVGIVDSNGRRVVTYGQVDKRDPEQLSGSTIFEIGTATKVFTALLLADMVQHHEVALTDPVQKYLPGVKIPERGRPITLQDLALHTSGLPSEPTNLAPTIKDFTNPYADYSVKDLYTFLSSYRLQREPGSEWEYSNLGYAILGHALSLRAGKSYEELLQTRILRPLGMQSTGIKLSRDMQKRLAVGHNAQLDPISNWNFQVLASFGALHSSADDLMTFLAANLGFSKTALAPAMAAMLQPRHATNVVGIDNALGWQIMNFEGKQMVEKDGASYGYEAFMGYDPKARIGVVVLANAYTTMGISDIGRHLLDPSVPLRGTKQTAVTVDPAVLDNYVGRYQLKPDTFLTVTRNGDRMFASISGQPALEVFPESDRNFFYRVYDGQLHFETDAQGRGTAVVLYYRGNPQRGVRIEEQRDGNK